MKTSRLAKTFALSALGAVLVPTALRAATLNVTNSADDGSPGTLRYVLKFANNGDVINIPATTIVLTAAGGTALDTDGNSDLDVAKSVTFQGAGAGQTIIDGDGSTTHRRVFDADSDNKGAGIVFKDMTIQNGFADDGGTPTGTDGGGVLLHNSAMVRFENVELIGNSATDDGGAVANSDDGTALDSELTGEFIAINTTFTNNTAAGDGGAVFMSGCNGNWGGSAIINDSLFQGNEATSGEGGAFYEDCGNLNSDNTRFLDNKSGDQGGAISNDYGAIALTNCEISGNQSGNNGGGVANDSNTSIDHCVISGNQALSSSDGGGIYNDNQMYLTNSTISGNKAESNGGGIANDEALTADGITVTGNVSDFDSDKSGEGGGGIYNGYSLILLNSVVSGNTANNPSTDGDGDGGGGILAFDFVTINNTTIANNTVVGGDGDDNPQYNIDGGGGLYLCGDNGIITNSTISGNKVLTDHDGTGEDPVGGGIYLCDTTTIANTTIANNQADGHGGGIFNNTQLTLNNVTITGNVADANEGGDSNGDGGGIFNGTLSQFYPAGVLVTNSIIAGNTDASPGHEAPDCFNDFGVEESRMHIAGPNIIQDLTGCEIQGFTDQVKTVDPLLDSANLADNGDVDVGDPAAPQALQTISLQSGSPAIDAGDDTTCAPADENGVARPVGAHCDLGAVETSGSAGGTTGGETGGGTTGGTTTGGSSGSGGCSLIR